MKVLRTLAILPLITPAFGAWALVDDMEGANNWTNIQGTTGLATDPTNAGNKAYQLVGDAVGGSRGQAWHAMPTIADGSTGTVFFRVYTEDVAGNFDFVVGSSDVATPGAGFGDFDGYGRLADGFVDVRNTPSFSQVGPASAATWYNVWMVQNNTTAGTDDTTDLYYNTSGDASGGGSTFFIGGVFRNEATALVSLLARNNENGGNAYIDDIYIDTSGQNLINPVPEPGTALLGGLGALCLLRRRRH